MNFSLLFPSHEGSELSIGLLFIPCAAWVDGSKILFIPDNTTPHYQHGSLGRLLNLATFSSILKGRAKNIVIIIHNACHGTKEDLSSLITDCESEGYLSQTICSQQQTQQGKYTAYGKSIFFLRTFNEANWEGVHLQRRRTNLTCGALSNKY